MIRNFRSPQPSHRSNNKRRNINIVDAPTTMKSARVRFGNFKSLSPAKVHSFILSLKVNTRQKLCKKRRNLKISQNLKNTELKPIGKIKHLLNKKKERDTLNKDSDVSTTENSENGVNLTITDDEIKRFEILEEKVQRAMRLRRQGFFSPRKLINKLSSSYLENIELIQSDKLCPPLSPLPRNSHNLELSDRKPKQRDHVNNLKSLRKLKCDPKMKHLILLKSCFMSKDKTRNQQNIKLLFRMKN